MSDVLILQGARFGDLVQTKRLVLSLGKKSLVHLAIDKSLEKLAALLYQDAIIHPVNFHGKPARATLAENMATFGHLRQLDFEKIYNCNYSPLTTDICRLFPLRKVTGCRPTHNSDGGIDRSPWARLAFRLSSHRVFNSLNLVDYWGYMAAEPIAPQDVNPPAAPGGAGIGVAVAGRESRRSLPAPILAEIIHIAFQVMNGPEIKLFGSQAEAGRARGLMRHFSAAMLDRTNDLCGKTDWTDLAAAMTGLDLLVTPDTGLMHLAAHLGVPVMAFFLSSAWFSETGPYGSGHLIWQSAPDCSPCLESKPCPRNTTCLDPFAAKNFARLLTLTIKGAKLPDMPANLQLWRSGFDSIGALPDLVAGTDSHSLARLAARAFIAAHIGIEMSAGALAKLPPREAERLEEALFPPDEWVFPPRRYC